MSVGSSLLAEELARAELHVMSASMSTTNLAATSSDGPWIDSDTWYAIGPRDGDTLCYYNLRRGICSRRPPTGLRDDGTRRRSAARCGPWAVPLTEPVPWLPHPLAMPVAAASHDRLGSKAPLVEEWGSNALLFTAPHGVNLARDGKPDHLPEDFTSYLARAWGAHTQAMSMSWDAASLEWVCAHEQPLPDTRDPNYLTEHEADTNQWVRALGGLDRRGLHIDVHGKADRYGEADLDVGVGALRKYHGDAAADAIADTLAVALRAVLGPAEYTVDERPRLQGCWQSVPRQTMTQSATKLGYVPVQIELGYKLRRALGRERALCVRVADTFSACASTCMAVCRLAAR